SAVWFLLDLRLPYGGAWIEHQSVFHAMTARAPSWRRRFLIGGACFLCRIVFAGAGEVPKLPAPADVKIDFVRDIKPILENSCIRCHGPERPRSHFRLDSREAALKGGDNGVDIIPGNSAGSSLIRYVAGLEPDMMMPPVDKGRGLTTNEI